MKPSRRCSNCRTRWTLAALCLTLAVALLGSACSKPKGAASSEETPVEIANPTYMSDGSAVVSTDGKALGTVVFPNSCDEAAQEPLQRGLALLHHMTYLAAEAAFQAAAEADPECALAHWGIAMTYVHPLWPDVVPAEKLTAGRELLAQAVSAGNTSDRARSYIEALGAYYGPADGESDEKERLLAFQAGWKAAHEAHPEDPEAALFYALSLLGTASPSDKSYDNQKAAGAITTAVLADVPRHPGAHHYTIHAYDFPPLAEDAIEVARSYDDVAPENSHALHMTSHIFTRRGLWPESIEFNIRAADAASERTPSGMISMHKLHALDYLAYAYLQMADDVEADAVLDTLEALEPPFQNHAGTAYSFAAVPTRIALERHAWDEAAAVEAGWPDTVPWDQYPHLLAIPNFARALGAARSGDFAAAEMAITRLTELEEGAKGLPGAYDWGIQVEIQKLAAQAWLAYEQGDRETALALMREAAEKEGSTEKNPVTPGEVLPARELYGDMLLATADYAGALREYEAALERSPNRFNSLFGAGQAAEKAGDAETATKYYRQLLEIAPEATGGRPGLEHAKQKIG